MADLKTGVAVAGYRIEAVLGHGSMGTVYSALDVALERRVALKVLTSELSRDDRFRERFLRESKVAASLEHPHIVPIHAAGEADGVLYLAMRYIEGRDLATLLKTLGRLDPERVVAILRQVAAALDVAHARGLVHRDVKPANILLTRHDGEDDYAYLCDFGLAKHASTVSSLTGSRAIMGTVDYLAPEQIEGKPVDGRVDVYALGCVLYECLTGDAPFERGNEIAALLAHVNDAVPTVSGRRADLPATLDQVVAVALAKDRDERFGSCMELVDASRAALRGDVPAVPEPARSTAEAVRTFLFADVRGYTAYTREQGDEAGAALATKFAAIVEELAPRHAGTLQELRGDEALVVFDSARQALRFALALQAKVAEEELPRPVGVGLDAGEAVPVEGGYRGGALNRAARLCALARPDDVLASNAVRELAGATDGVAYGFRRVEKLKGFEKPVGVVEIHPAERAPQRELARQLKRRVVGTRPRLRLLIAGVVAVAVAVPLALLGGASSANASPFKPDSIGFVDMKTLKPAGSLDRLGAPFGMWADPSGAVWAGGQYGGSIVRLDPRTQQATTTISFGYSFGSIAFGAGSVWIGDDDDSAVYRYSAAYGSLEKRIPLPYPKKNPKYAISGYTEGLAYGAGSIWVGYGKYQFRVARIDPATNHITKIFDFPASDGPALLQYGNGSLWIASQDRGHVYRIDPHLNRVVARGKIHGGPVTDLKIVDGDAWLLVPPDGAVWQVDHNGTPVRSYHVGAFPQTLAAADGNLYVANGPSGTIVRLNAATGKLTTIHVGHDVEGEAVAGGRLWVAVHPTVADATAGLPPSSVLRASIVDDPYGATDPAIFATAGVQLQDAIGARLLRYPDVAQPTGATLLPEIADLPTVSNDGKTYTFRIRPGWRFSPPSNAPITAAVMQYSIERALSPKFTVPAFGSAFMQDLVGFKAYYGGNAAHVSGIRVHGNEISFTLTSADADFPARISTSFFSAVPIGTPIRPHGVDQPIPSAGPYYLAGGNAIVLRRNPNYHGPRPQHFAAIVLQTDVGAGAPAQVAADKSDYSWTDVTPPTDLAAGGLFEKRFGAQSAAARSGDQRYFRPVMSGIRFIDFDAESGVFRDPTLREAVGYALDRPALAAATNDLAGEDFLPPGIPGTGRTPIYPLGGPDLAKARVLMQGRHVHAVLFAHDEESCAYCASVVSTIQGDLARIGIDVVVKTSPDPIGAASDPDAHWDLLLEAGGILDDFTDPGDFLNAYFGSGVPGLVWGHQAFIRYGDAHYVNALDAAFQVAGPARAATYRRVDAEMFRNSPPAAVYATDTGSPQIFSSRIGCEIFRPQDYGLVDLAALCLK